MLQMDLSGPNGLMIRQSSSTASTGQTTISDIGGGQFQISSFFDVFTELSLDSGQTWTPSQQGTILTLAPVPEPSTMIAGALLLLPFGLQGIRKLRNSRQQVA